MKETPQQMAARLMSELDAKQKTSFTRGEVKSILNSIYMLPAISDVGCRAPAAVEGLQRGDVFIYSNMGGKVRPWIALRVIGDAVSACPISSGDSAPCMIKAQCRLWPGAWIGPTIALFKVENALREVTRPYTNLAHLKEIEALIVLTHQMGV